MMQIPTIQYKPAVAYNICFALFISIFLTILIGPTTKKKKFLGIQIELSCSLCTWIPISILAIVTTIFINLQNKIFISAVFIFLFSIQIMVQILTYQYIIDKYLVLFVMQYMLFLMTSSIILSEYNDIKTKNILILVLYSLNFLSVLMNVRYKSQSTSENILEKTESEMAINTTNENKISEEQEHNIEKSSNNAQRNNTETESENNNTETESQSENTIKIESQSSVSVKENTENSVRKLKYMNRKNALCFIVLTVTTIPLITLPCDGLKFLFPIIISVPIQTDTALGITSTGTVVKHEQQGLVGYFFIIDSKTNIINLFKFDKIKSPEQIMAVGIFENNVLVFKISNDITTNIRSDYLASFDDKLIRIRYENETVAVLGMNKEVTVRLNRTSNLYFDDTKLMPSDLYIFDQYLDTITNNPNSESKVKVYHSEEDGCVLIYPDTSISLGYMDSNSIIHINMNAAYNNEPIFLRQNNILYYLSPTTNKYIAICQEDQCNYESY